MRLYFSPGACSLSPHIVLREAGLKFDLERVDLGAKKTAKGDDFRKVNPKGQVPVLETDTGDVLTEGPMIVQYIADQSPDAKLMPAPGTMQRYRVQEWLNFITSEIHKGFSPLFKSNTPDDYKPVAKANLADRYALLDKHLANNKYLAGDAFSVADAYLFTVTNWNKSIKVELDAWPNVKTYMERIAARPKVQEAMKAEGLIK